MKRSFLLILSIMFLSGLNQSCTPKADPEPEIISTGTAVNISSFTATLHATIGGLTSTQISQGRFGFLYLSNDSLNGRTATDIFQDCLNNNLTGSCSVQYVVSIQPGGKFWKDFNKLRSSCTYHYCAFIVKSDNTYYSGTVSTFSTTAFPPEMSTGVATDLNFYRAKLSGSVLINKADLTSSNIGIVYSTSNTPTPVTGTLVRYSLELDDKGNFTVPVSNLKPGTQYYYRTYAYAKDEKRYYYSNIDSFRTRDLSEMAIDLGLSVKWASCNLGANDSKENGDYFRWGETEPNGTGSREGYMYYDDITRTYIDLGEDISGTEYDVAHVKLGGKWRMPTKAEYEELKSRCYFEDLVAEDARKVTGPSGKHLVFRNTGALADGDSYPGGISYLWCSSANNNYPYVFINAHVFIIDEYNRETEELKGLIINYMPHYSFPIRPVCDY